MDLEHKSIFGEIKDIDTKNQIVTGYLSSFGNKDHDGDIMEKGAFSKSINERKNDIFFLNQHNWAQPHGKFKVLKEDSFGLYFESEPLIKGVSYSDDLMKLYDAGIIKEHSIGFRTIKSDYDSKSNTRTIKEVKLFEGSNVTLGANSNTPYLGTKNLTLKDINDQCNRLYKAIRNGTFTDETFTLLEYALKDLQTQAYKLGEFKALEKQDEPLVDTQENVEEPQSHIKTINEFLKTL